VSVQSTTGSRGVHISGSNGSNAGYTMFRGSVKSTGYPLHSPVSPSIPLPCGTVCHHISTGLYCVSAYTVGELKCSERYTVYIYISISTSAFFSSPHMMFTEVETSDNFNIIHFSCNFIISTEVQYQFFAQYCATSWH